MAYTPAFPVKCYRCSHVIVEPEQARIVETGDSDTVVVCDNEADCNQRAIAFVMEEIDTLRWLMQHSAPAPKSVYKVLTTAMDKLHLVLNETGERALSRPMHRCLLCGVQLPITLRDSVLCKFCRTI